MDKAVRPTLPKSAAGDKIVLITVNYSCIPGSNRNLQARTILGAWIDHPTPEYPQYKQYISIEYAAACDVRQVFVPTKSFFWR